MAKANKLVLPAVLDSLRNQGFKPLHSEQGGIQDYRRVRNHQLEIREVTVHPSGRVTVQHRKE